jgi:hypothetical protein
MDAGTPLARSAFPHHRSSQTLATARLTDLTPHKHNRRGTINAAPQRLLASLSMSYQ